MFKQVKQNRAFEDVFSQIEALILDGGLKAGDKLPGERQLTEIFKVSRGTLREAFRALEQKGLIEIRTGMNGGAFVCQVDMRQMSESLDLLLRCQKISTRELAEFREGVEGLVTKRATERATKENLEELKCLLESIKSRLGGREPEWTEIREIDIKFHLYLAHIGGNQIFESVLHTIYDNIDRYFDRFLPIAQPISKRTYRDLREILRAVEGRKPDLAKTLAEKHVRRFNSVMERAQRH